MEQHPSIVEQFDFMLSIIIIEKNSYFIFSKAKVWTSIANMRIWGEILEEPGCLMVVIDNLKKLMNWYDVIALEIWFAVLQNFWIRVH